MLHNPVFLPGEEAPVGSVQLSCDHGGSGHCRSQVTCSQRSYHTLEGLNFTFHVGQRDGIDISRSFRHPYLKVVSSATSCDHLVLWKSTNCVGLRSIPYPALQSFVAEQRDFVAWSATGAVISTACLPHLPRSTTLPRHFHVVTCRTPQTHLSRLQQRLPEALPVCPGDHVFLCDKIHESCSSCSHCSRALCPSVVQTAMVHVMNFLDRMLKLFSLLSCTVSKRCANCHGPHHEFP